MTMTDNQPMTRKEKRRQAEAEQMPINDVVLPDLDLDEALSKPRKNRRSCLPIITGEQEDTATATGGLPVLDNGRLTPTKPLSAEDVTAKQKELAAYEANLNADSDQMKAIEEMVNGAKAKEAEIQAEAANNKRHNRKVDRRTLIIKVIGYIGVPVGIICFGLRFWMGL